MSKPRWGDADEDEDVLPESTTTGPNEKGVLTKTEYYHNSAGEPTRKTTKIQLVKVQTRVYEVTAERRNWPKFGQAAKSNEGVTVQSVDEIMFERNNLPKKAEKELKPENALGEMSLTEMLAEKRRHRELMRAQGLLDPIPEAPGKEDGPPGGGANTSGKYVPPARKAGAVGAFGDRRDTDPSLRVSNLSENVSDHDLKQLFQPFGDVSRVYVAKDRDTNEHRGFAFVNFRIKSQAEAAIRALNGYGFDNMILRVEMAEPRVARA